MPTRTASTFSPMYSDDSEVEPDNNNNNNNRHSPKTTHYQNVKSDVSLKTYFAMAFAIACTIYLLYTMTSFVYFLSGDSDGILNRRNLKQDISSLHIILLDFGLLLIFIIQHRIMATQWYKNLMQQVFPFYLERCVYNLATAMAIKLLTSSWLCLSYSSFVLWDYRACEIFKTVCRIFQILSWIQTFGVVYLFDISDFIGLKQVFYRVNSLGCPMHRKSYELQRLFQHFRHPTVVGLLIIFWLVPCMTMDRLLLATVLTWFLFSTNLDNKDYIYSHSMYEKKVAALLHR